MVLQIWGFVLEFSSLELVVFVKSIEVLFYFSKYTRTRLLIENALAHK